MLAQLSSEYGIVAAQITDWKQQTLPGLHATFGSEQAQTTFVKTAADHAMYPYMLKGIIIHVICFRAYTEGHELGQDLSKYFRFYNQKRKYQ